MIELKNLSKTYGKIQVLKNINFTIENKGIIALLGPNGSGKTTLMKSLLGMVIPSGGDIFFDGQSVKNNWEYRKKISYLPQIANFPSNLTVCELIRMIKDLKQQPCTEAQQLIHLFGLEPHLGKKLGNLSGGTKQKVNLVMTFMVDTPYLLLDEPTSGLDPLSVLTLKKLILSQKQKGKTVIVTSHILNFVEEISDEILFILEGNVFFSGTLSALLEQTQAPDFEQAIASFLQKQ